ncbi:MAG: GNAT family N-acetyltransferase [Anaerolineae bacterium]
MTTIRRALISDYDHIIAILAEADAIHCLAEPDYFRTSTESRRPRELIEQWLASEDYAIYVAEEDSRSVGVLILNVRSTPDTSILKFRRYVNIDILAVKEGWRSQGIGHALLEQAEDYAKSIGLDQVELSVWEFNQRALALYEKTGFRTLRRYMAKKVT